MTKWEFTRRYAFGAVNKLARRLLGWGGWDNPIVRVVTIVAGAMLLWLAITVPLSLLWQTLFALAMFALALFLRRYIGHEFTLLLMLLSVFASTRYLYWRITETVGGPDPMNLILGLGLLGAEMYAWLVLVFGFFQTAWPLGRKPLELPQDEKLLPTVDVFIPTYDEPINVVRTTVLAALALEWPAEKLKIYLLDDGRRPEFREFAETVGVEYLIRQDNKHAKAGNINNALKYSSGEFIAIFDCDHMPTQPFLKTTMGWFLSDPKLAMLQTPHHFLSPDPFERNLRTFRHVPNEGELFHGLIQDGNDLWNAAFFCGSCAVLRRSALLEVGGAAVETVTEDAHTSLKMQRLGYNTAYIGVPRAAGLATESLSAHVGQRIRWARGMAQIFRIDNPFLGEGLTWAQRLCYANSMLHFFNGLPRIIFLTAPLAYLFFEAHIVQAPALLFAAYGLPHVIHAMITNSRMQGAHRHTFWAEVYESTLAWHILRPTLAALISPKRGRFNVTAKGGLIEKEYFDWDITKPHLIMLALNVAGLAIGIPRLLWWNSFEIDTVVLNLLWTLYNVVNLSTALAVAYETRQVRRSHRVSASLPATVRFGDGSAIACSTEDLSERGLGLRLPAATPVPLNQKVSVSLFRGGEERPFPAHVVRGPEELVFTARVVESRGDVLGVQFDDLTLQQRKDLVQCTFARRDAWVNWSEARAIDRPLVGFKEILMHSVSGITRLFAAMRMKIGLSAGQTFDAARVLFGRGRRYLGRERRGSARAGSGAVGTWLAIPVLLVLAASTLTPAPVRAAVANSGVQVSEWPGGQKRYSYSLRSLGAYYPVQLRGVSGAATMPFSVRADEVVTAAKIKLDFGYSPAMLPELSHLKVLVNNDVGAILPLPREGAAGTVKEVSLNPRLFTDFNKLTLQLIGHYTLECEDPLHSSLWATVSNQSVLELTVSPLSLRNDLSLLPAPFFDRRDGRLLTLPMVFGATPSMDTLQSAGIVASWLGGLASYRGARFPVELGKLPPGQAVVFATPSELPAGIQLPSLSGPTISVVTHPNNASAKLLLILGRDPQELKTAALGLTLGQVALSGASVVVTQIKDLVPRKPYDAPNWIPVTRLVKFEELAAREELQVSGLSPDAIRVNLRVPPDIFTWRHQGAPIDLRYRYTPRPGAEKSTLNVSVNDGFIRALPLAPAEAGVHTKRFLLPVIEDGVAVAQDTVVVPPFQVGARNQLQFQYYFEYLKEGECKDVLVDNYRGAVDADSTIDFTSFQHYTSMPNLAHFANAGYPFTRLADLSETAVVLPERLDAVELETYLTLMGHMGESTGYPATSVTLAKAADVSTHAGKDLLVIGSADDQPLLAKWAQHMPLNMMDGTRKLQLPGPMQRLLARWEGRDLEDVIRRAGEMTLQAGNGLGAIMAFESPLQKGRNVIVVASSIAERLSSTTQPFFDAEAVGKVQGDLTLINGNQVNGFLVGDVYHLGSLSWWTKLRWYLSTRPWWLVLIVVIACVLLGVVLYRMLRRRAAARLKGA
jgi:cellulose synthase (UDP-forming)